MSSPARNSNNHSATEGSGRKRPRHFHQGPDEIEEEEKETTAAAQHPAVRLYRHALESIFGFLSLFELSTILAVSRSWSAAVCSMRSLDAHVKSLPAARSLSELCASQLARHIGTLGKEHRVVSVTRAELAALSLRMTGLHSLHIKVASSSDAFRFPPSVTWLNCEASMEASAVEINELIEAASHLPKLRRAELNLWKTPAAQLPKVILDPLLGQACRETLRVLGVYYDALFDPAHVQAVRSMPQLTHVMGLMSSTDLRSLLQPPPHDHGGHQELQWQSLSFRGHLDEEMVGLLRTLPALTHLVVDGESDATFLKALPNLQHLELTEFAIQPSQLQPLLTPELMFAGVGTCAQLTQLSIWDTDITTDHLSVLLSHMPALHTLSLDSMLQLESLSFLSSPPLVSSLANFSLIQCRHPNLRASELRHLYGLQQLTKLKVSHSFGEKLDSMSLLDLQVPSLRLPRLLHSVVRFKAEVPQPDEENGVVEVDNGEEAAGEEVALAEVAAEAVADAAAEQN